MAGAERQVCEFCNELRKCMYNMLRATKTQKNVGIDIASEASERALRFYELEGSAGVVVVVPLDNNNSNSIKGLLAYERGYKNPTPCLKMHVVGEIAGLTLLNKVCFIEPWGSLMGITLCDHFVNISDPVKRQEEKITSWWHQ